MSKIPPLSVPMVTLHRRDAPHIQIKLPAGVFATAICGYWKAVQDGGQTHKIPDGSQVVIWGAAGQQMTLDVAETPERIEEVLSAGVKRSLEGKPWQTPGQVQLLPSMEQEARDSLLLTLPPPPEGLVWLETDRLVSEQSELNPMVQARIALRAAADADGRFGDVWLDVSQDPTWRYGRVYEDGRYISPVTTFADAPTAAQALTFTFLLHPARRS